MDEHSPLLSNQSNHSNHSRVPRDDRRQFPKLQILILLLVQLSEPIAYSVILPFVNQLVHETGITHGDYGKVGYYGGLIDGLFFATEAIMVYHWGRLSDRIGRKPVLLTGVFGLMLSMISFGLSKTFWALVVSRLLAGALNGNIGVAKATMAEICDAESLSRVAAYVAVMWQLGETIGLFLGGSIAHPYERYPRIFGGSKFWEKYPYFLPCFSAASISIITFILGSLFFKETRRREAAPRKHHAIVNNTPPSDSEDSQEPVESHRRSTSLLTSRILIPIANYAMLALAEVSFVVVLPLFLSTPIEIGGLGFSTSAIGMTMGVTGCVNMVFQATCFYRFQSTFGSKEVFVAGMTAFIFMFTAFPIMNAIARQSDSVSPTVWAILAIQLSFCLPVNMTWSCIFLIINDAVPPEALGAANGLAQTTASVMRAIGPTAVSSLFAISVEKKTLGGLLVYVVTLLVSLIGIFATYFL